MPLLVAIRKGKPRYTPPKEEFLKYSDWDYYETTPQLLTLKAALSEYISDPELVLDVLEEIHDMCSAEARIQEFLDLLNSVGVKFEGMGQVEGFVQLIMDVQNNTRLWSNYGHTPSELFAADKSNLIPLPARPASVAKIGRNDPCPCGSGKKYKHCCGR